MRYIFMEESTHLNFQRTGTSIRLLAEDTK